MRVLGLETSCDETGVAIYDSEQGLLAEALYSQIALHAEFGGVVPELASRDHVRKLLPLVREDVGLLAFSLGLWMVLRQPRWRWAGVGLLFY